MGNIRKYSDVIDRWNDIQTFASDIGIGPKHAHGMRARDSIPPSYWPAVVTAANKRADSEVTYELLAKLAGQPGPMRRLRRPQGRRKARKKG